VVQYLRLIFTDGIYEFDTNEFGRDIPYKIFKAEPETAFDYTGYTVVLRLLSDGLSILNDISPLSTTPASGTGTFEFSTTNKPLVSGYYFIEAKLTKSGEQLYALSPRLYIRLSPD
jgi:hypothetical protein